jgi:hypothetical protein
MKRKRRNSFKICNAARHNPTGHIGACCAYSGGPYEERGFQAAIAAARAGASYRTTSGSCTANGKLVRQLWTPRSVVFRRKHRRRRFYRAATSSKEEPSSICYQLSDLQNKQMDGSLAYKIQIRELEQQASGHERHIIPDTSGRL